MLFKRSVTGTKEATPPSHTNGFRNELIQNMEYI